MKFLLVLLVVLFGVWMWRSGRGQRDLPKDAPRRPAAPEAQKSIEMVRCAVCGLHCPRTDALAGARGMYCSAKHRSQAEP